MSLAKIPKADLVAILSLLAWHFVYFFPVTLGQSVWFTRDISRLYYPFAVEFSRALAEGRLPLWSPSLQAGFPLLAEGHVAAFYPFQVLFVKLFSPESAISYQMLLHLSVAGIGMYAWVRGMGFRAASAFVAGFIFSFNGFMVQKLYHTPILLTAAWLPWMIFFQDQFQRARRDRKRHAGVWLALATLALALDWVAGFPQIAFMNAVTFAAVGLFGGLFWNGAAAALRERLRQIPRIAFWTALPVVLSGGIAAVQLLPTTELIGYSVRSQGLPVNLINSYNLTPESFTQFVSPFSPGEPSDDNIELWGYVGLATLFLAIAAPFVRRDSRTVFFSIFAIIVLSLTLGDANPLFSLLSRLPIFSLFRVPARYLFLFAFSAAFLAANGLDEISRRGSQNVEGRLRPFDLKSTGATAPVAQRSGVNALVARHQNAIVAVPGTSFALAIIGVISLAYTQSLEFWLGAWQWLSWVIGTLALILLWLGWTRRIANGVMTTAIIGLVVFDLSANAATYLHTKVAELTPPAYVNQTPRSATALGVPISKERVLTDETVWPSVQSQRSSLYPNFGLVYGREMVHAYTPLLFEMNDLYFFNLSPAMLDLLNARYFSIPLEPRFTDRAPTPFADLTLDVVDSEASIPPTPAVSIQVDSFTEETATIPNGSPAAELILKFDDGAIETFTLRVGADTADWDFGKNGAPSQARIAHKVSAFLRALGRPFDGAVYRAQFTLGSSPHKVVSVDIRPIIPKAHITVERIALIGENGKPTSLAALTHKDEFQLFFMSDTAAIWENLDVLPRAFLAHQAQVMKPDAVFARLHQPDLNSGETVLLNEGQAMSAAPNVDRTRERVEITRYEPERVTMTVRAEQPGYLVLADSWYPGWNAYVDGQAQPIYRADFIFRAVKIEPGEHTVLFEFRPQIVYIGAGISIASLCVLALVAAAVYRSRI